MKAEFYLENAEFKATSVGVNPEKHGDDIVLVKVIDGKITVPVVVLQELNSNPSTDYQNTLFRQDNAPNDDLELLGLRFNFKDHVVTLTADRDGEIPVIDGIEAKKITKFKIKELHEGGYVDVSLQLHVDRGSEHQSYQLENLLMNTHFLSVSPPVDAQMSFEKEESQDAA